MLRIISSLLGGLSFATLLNRLGALSVEKDGDRSGPSDPCHSQGLTPRQILESVM